MKLEEKTVSACLQNLAAILSAWFILAFLFIALSSITYPFQLEWIEGQTMDTVQRAREGLPIYTTPTLQYVALLYTPLFYYASALVSFFTGLDFIAGRSVSLLATCGTLWLFAKWIKREGGSGTQAIIAAGLFCATYRLSGRWFDIARVDSLSVFFSIASLYALRFGTTPRDAVKAGLLITAAFFTKQITIGLLLPVCLLTIALNRRFGLIATITAIASLALCIGLYDYSSDGWFTLFCFRIPLSHRADPAQYWNFWKTDLLSQQGYIFAAILFALAATYEKNRKLVAFLATILLAVLLATYSSRLHMYGWINNLMPLHAVLALLAGLGLVKLSPSPRAAIPASLLLIIQLMGLLYDPHPLIPTQKSVEQGNNFLKELQNLPGDAFLPDIQFIPQRAGKTVYSYGMGAYDLFRADLGPRNDAKKALGDALQAAIAQQKFGVIIPGMRIHYNLPMLNQRYNVAQTLDYPEGYALDSQNMRRVQLFVPKPNQENNP